MPVPDNAAVARVVMRFFRDSRIFEIIHHCAKQNGAPLVGTDLDTLALAYQTWADTVLRQWLWNSMRIWDVTVTKLDPDDPIQRTQDIDTLGTIAQDPAPGNATLAVGSRTGKAGRKFRGRSYHPYLPDSAINADDTISSPWLVGLVGAYGALRGILGFSTVPPFDRVIFHRASNLYTPTIEETSDANVDSMRTRLQSRGI